MGRVVPQVWSDLYASESGWLDHALAEFDLPKVSEIFTTFE
jgi:hypothetical protein